MKKFKTLPVCLIVSCLVLSSCGEDTEENAEFASCGSFEHGETESRTMYLAATVPYGFACASQTQTRTCDDGTWSDWSGTYTFESCTVDSNTDDSDTDGNTDNTALNCGSAADGSTESRVRYETDSVASGSCNQETQYRVCDGGSWTAWSGTYTYESCSVDGYDSCGSVPHGGTEQRTMYENDVEPYGSECTSQTQTRICDDGTWGSWSGTYTYETCTMENATTCDQQTNHGYGVCSEWLGPNWGASVEASCQSSVGIAGTSCPDGYIGICDMSEFYGGDEDIVIQYHYTSTVYPDAAASETACLGEWSAP